MNRVFSISLFLSVFLCAQANASLQKIATVAHWPGVSQLIAYKDRIWFVSSQPYEDTNVADIYSHAPGSATIRYERSLFSQDAGNPVVYRGLLFWPYEDPRRSAGNGEYAVTDGTRWDWRSMDSGSVMHVHAMGVCNDQLVAATGSWTGQLHRLDASNTWQVQYEYPAGAAPFSRLVGIREFDQRCIIGASANGESQPKLFSVKGSTPTALPGWPSSDRVDEITSHKGALYAFADSDSGRSLIWFDGSRTSTIKLPKDHRPRGLHSDGTTLWLISRNTGETDQRGALWTLDEAGRFTSVTTFDQTPVDVTSHGNQVFIGTYARHGGALWSWTREKTESTKNNDDQQNSLPDRNEPSLDERLVDSLYEEIRELVNDPANAARYARGLRRNLSRHPEQTKPEFGAALTRLLETQIAGEPVTMFTRQPVPYQELVQWYVISTLAINGYGYVDPKLISRTPDIANPASGKLFNPTVAAIVASGWLKQDDPATIGALIDRLNVSANPAWLVADIVGALTAITGKRFAYDIDAWSGWWKQQP